LKVTVEDYLIALGILHERSTRIASIAQNIWGMSILRKEEKDGLSDVSYS
jgi:hypothetical protein